MIYPNGVAVNIATICIPYTNYHERLVERAIESAATQTIPSAVLTFRDVEKRGAGYARNRLAEQVKTPFLVWLDADDWLEPTFIEETITRYERGVYIYTDHHSGAGIHRTPDECTWHYGTWHGIGCLIPTALHHLVGGFDETLLGMEDAAYFLALQAAGVCGRRCPKPLYHYTGHGLRSQGFTTLANYDRIRNNIYEHYAQRIAMGCGCGAKSENQQTPEHGKQDGDILAQALYTPMLMLGPATGRVYPRPRGFEGYRLWVDPRDALTKPDYWQPVEGTVNPKDISPDVDEVLALAGAALAK